MFIRGVAITCYFEPQFFNTKMKHFVLTHAYRTEHFGERYFVVDVLEAGLKAGASSVPDETVLLHDCLCCWSKLHSAPFLLNEVTAVTQGYGPDSD